MDESRFAAWKYQHPGAGYRSRQRLLWAAALFIASLFFASKLWPLAIVLFIASLITVLTSTRKILVGTRYLICGSEIVYFANVERVDRDDVAGILRLTGNDGRSLLIDRDKFPTNARKAHKILNNKLAKFTKVAERIITHVQAANPAADIQVRC